MAVNETKKSPRALNYETYRGTANPRFITGKQERIAQGLKLGSVEFDELEVFYLELWLENLDHQLLFFFLIAAIFRCIRSGLNRISFVEFLYIVSNFIEPFINCDISKTD